MLAIKSRVIRLWLQALSVTTLIILLAGCSTAQPTTSISNPTPTPTPTPIPAPDITGMWTGCIQGKFSPNEAITLNVSNEQTSGTFSGIYTENFYFIGVVLNISIVGHWDVYNAQINLDNSIQFSADPKENVVGFDGENTNAVSGTHIYNFTGTLSDGTLSGKVDEKAATDDIRNWTLTRDGKCPY